MTTADRKTCSPPPRVVSLGFIAPSAALGLYDLACTVADPGAFETAAHALADALTQAKAGARPPRGSLPRLIVSNPTPQSAHAPAKSNTQSAPEACR